MLDVQTAQQWKDTLSLRYVSVDLMLKRAMTHADITRLSLPSNTFDNIFGYHVLEHVSELPALAELYRVLEPNGSLFIQVPIDISRNQIYEVPDATPDQYEQLYGQNDHLRVYGTNFSEVLTHAGFSIMSLRYIENFSQKERVQLGLKDTYRLKNYMTCEDIYIASK